MAQSNYCNQQSRSFPSSFVQNPSHSCGRVLYSYAMAMPCNGYAMYSVTVNERAKGIAAGPTQSSF
eukprot:992785-Amphidinium_carterae.1